MQQENESAVTVTRVPRLLCGGRQRCRLQMLFEAEVCVGSEACLLTAWQCGISVTPMSLDNESFKNYFGKLLSRQCPSAS